MSVRVTLSKDDGTVICFWSFHCWGVMLHCTSILFISHSVHQSLISLLIHQTFCTQLSSTKTTMAASIVVHHTSLVDPQLLDIVDDDWAAATLPDDDVPLPASVVPPTDDLDAEQLDELEAMIKGTEKWSDLGLHTVQ